MFGSAGWKHSHRTGGGTNQDYEAGLKGLVLDLRDNPGGLLTQSARVAENSSRPASHRFH